MVRAYTAQQLGMKVGDLRVYPAEIGGAFGGKTVVYVEPVATMLARKSGHPVKVVMSREDVFKATGPTSGSAMTVKIGAKRDGTIVAADGVFRFQAGAFPGSPVMNACMCAFAPYDIANARTPTLVFVGENDPRVPMPQSVELYRALKSNGVPTHLYVAPREPHGWAELRHQLFKMNAELDWFERYATGRTYVWEKAPAGGGEPARADAELSRQ